MDFKIVWTNPAIADLEKIVTYISLDNPSANQRVGDEIIRHVEILAALTKLELVFKLRFWEGRLQRMPLNCEFPPS